MAKRGYKLQEFLAHSGNVNCLNIGKKACRHFVTGGDDHQVNVWAIGKPTALTSLSGHTSPVESTTFDSTEVLVLAGASSGVIKQWDLEEAKMVRTLSGHRSNCTSVEFHPFGEFFASGSMDTNLRIWDIRKKGCIHTYKGHTQGIGTIKFTPDGRWVVSGGNDNVVKVWDLTAGKLLHDFKFHEGPIRSLDFHPLEFLLASGSSDRTVKFWDLETFELIGSTRPEATGVRSIAFHPDGRTLFSGQEESLKVYSWEPVISHDAVDMGWSTLGDICIHEEKLMGCSYFQNSVAIWVADISLIEPYGDASQPDHTDQKFNLNLHESSEGMEKFSNLRCRSPDYDTKEIKNIYVDSSGGKPVITQKIDSTPPKVPPYSDKEISNQFTKKQSRVLGTPPKPNDPHALEKSSIVPSIMGRDSPDGKDVTPNGESITFSRTKRGMLLRPAHIRKPSNSKNDLESLPNATESGNFGNTESKCQTKIVSEDTKIELCDAKVNCATNRVENVVSPPRCNSEDASSKDIDATKTSNSVKVVNGVAVVRGRTMSLVERFEKREQSSTNEDQANFVNQPVVTEVDKALPIQANVTIQPKITEVDETPPRQARPVVTEVDKTPPRRVDVVHRPVVTEVDKTPTIQATVVHRPVVTEADRTSPRRADVVFRPLVTAVDKTPKIQANDVFRPAVAEVDKTPPRRANAVIRPMVNRVDKTTPRRANPVIRPVVKEVDKTPPRRASVVIRPVIPEVDKTPPRQASAVVRPVIPEEDKTPPILIQREEPQDSEGDFISVKTRDATEDLMHTHDIFLSTLRMRLTKLQVVRHFWERKDIKGAIGAMRKLPDHSVQADVISVLMNKMDNLTLDLFSILLPVLVGLLNSQMDRHAILSLEMLLKLVAVFGPVIRSAVSARRGVGVDLHAEQRRECCNQCSTQLQQIQKILPSLVRRGGLVAKSALELNLVLQES